MFSRAELQRIFNKNTSLLMVVSKPNMSQDLFPDLAMSLGNKLNIFVGRYFPENDEMCSVQFYSDFFDRAVSKAQLTQLQAELPTPTASIYTDITSKEVFFNVRLQGLDEPLTETLQAWNWRDFRKTLVTETGCTEEEALEEIEDIIIQVHKVLAGFLADWYYLNVNPHHLPRLLSRELESEQLPAQWLLPCVKALVETKTRLLQLLSDKQAREAAENLRKAELARLQKEREDKEKREQLARERKEKEERERLAREKGVPLTFNTVKAGQRGSFTVYEKTFDIKGTQLVMVYVPAGEFMMGSNEYDSEKPVHKVKIEQAFYMGKFPVTQGQYKAVMGENPSNFKGNVNLPAESMTWSQAKEFCEKLYQITKQEFRLPSEAEWEYACRAGTSTKYWWGDGMEDFRCWYDGNSGDKTHPVDEKVNEHMNPFGLCDMHGNVWEWCEDSWEGNYKTSRTQVAYKNSSENRLLRGGSWLDFTNYCRSAYRSLSSDRCGNYGFRVVSLPPARILHP